MAKRTSRVLVRNKVVNMEGDEMTRVIWSAIKRELIHPYLELETVDFDLSITNRDLTDDRVSTECAYSILEHGVGIKCATITPDQNRVDEFKLKRMYPSPNGTIRNILNGTVFREPIVLSNVPRLVRTWNRPIIVARHAFGDQYKAVDMQFGAGCLLLKFVAADGTVTEHPVHQFPQTGGVGLAMFNTMDSIRAFADCCFRFALSRRLPLYLSTKNTILKQYDGAFQTTFDVVYKDYQTRFEQSGIFYTHRLIDDMVAQSMKSDGGFVWACKNYDGDIQSDAVAQGFGSLGLMTSVLITPDGRTMESEAAHGTVTRHFRDYQLGKPTSTNPIASIFAWTRGLMHRATLDDTPQLTQFCQLLEQAVRDVVEGGLMTKDLSICIHGAEEGAKKSNYLYTDEFIAAVRRRLDLLRASLVP